jgi:hypothetical protein
LQKANEFNGAIHELENAAGLLGGLCPDEEGGGSESETQCPSGEPQVEVPASRGYDRLEVETSSGRAVRAQDATSRWDQFLGEGQTNIDPRDGLPDADRIWSADGERSIRCGDHEMDSSPNKFHYHEETWYDDHVDNVLQRVQK